MYTRGIEVFSYMPLNLNIADGIFNIKLTSFERLFKLQKKANHHFYIFLFYILTRWLMTVRQAEQDHKKNGYSGDAGLTDFELFALHKNIR